MRPRTKAYLTALLRSGVDFRVTEVTDLNRNGQILIGGRVGGRFASAILTPVN